MKIYVYSDESGVFDYNDKYFVYGGLIFLDYKNVEEFTRKYAAIEQIVRCCNNLEENVEVKATTVSNKSKNSIFRSMGNCYKFASVVKQDIIHKDIWNDKKSKQRFLDFVYKIAVKRAFEHLAHKHIISFSDVTNVVFYIDEHTTATNGRYELSESMETEFKYGSWAPDYSYHFPPLFKNLQSLKVNFCDSNAQRLVRASDFVANKIYYLCNSEQWNELARIRNFNIAKFPENKW